MLSVLSELAPPPLRLCRPACTALTPALCSADQSFVESPLAAELSEREREDLDHMMISRIGGQAVAPRL